MTLLKNLKSIFEKPKKAKKPIKKLAEKPITEHSKETKIVKNKKIKKSSPREHITKKKNIKEIYRILKKPHISEKATILTEKNKYIFKVYSTANKIEIKKATENLYGVRVKDVNIINVHRKQRILQGIKGFKTGYKKAIITLEKGEKIEIIPH